MMVSVAVRGTWRHRLDAGGDIWRRDDGDQTHGCIVALDKKKGHALPTFRYLWAVYGRGPIWSPAVVGYADTLEEALADADAGWEHMLGPREFVELP